MHVDEQVIKIINVCEWNSESIEEQVKEMENFIRKKKKAQAELQLNKLHLSLRKDVLEAELNRVTKASKLLSEPSNCKRKLISDLERKAAEIDHQLQENSQKISNCMEKLRTENIKMASLHKKLQQFSTNLKKCQTILTGCIEYANEILHTDVDNDVMYCYQVLPSHARMHRSTKQLMQQSLEQKFFNEMAEIYTDVSNDTMLYQDYYEDSCSAPDTKQPKLFDEIFRRSCAGIKELRRRVQLVQRMI